MCGMIKIGNLILRTMALVDFTNSRYFERYGFYLENQICGIMNTWNFEHVEK